MAKNRILATQGAARGVGKLNQTMKGRNALGATANAKPTGIVGKVKAFFGIRQTKIIGKLPVKVPAKAAGVFKAAGRGKAGGGGGRK